MDRKENQKNDDERCIAEKKTDGYSGNSKSLFFDNRIEREWLSTDEAAHYLRISANAIRIMVCRKQIRYHKVGRRLRFTLQDCLALFQNEGE